jgi:hypothetical protein
VSNLDVEIEKLMRRVDHFAARLNPGLSAIAIALSACLLAEIMARLPALYEAEIASEMRPSTIDQAPLLTIDVPPSE